MGICVSCRRRERKAPEKRSVPGAGGPARSAAAELLPRRVDRLPVMANSMSNIKMTDTIKVFVSKRRRRYMKDGFNLDLAYITDKLIAMGFPAEKLEGVYRNHIDEVYRFLEKMHKDHYKIYNLCSERSYDSSKFHERVERYAFEDHTPPNIEMIQPFCEDVHNWLSADSKNVAAVHCKAGKGRTGTMVCCYLLYSRQKATADEALKFYGTKRTHDDKGVTIPSQRRYVEYYAWLLHSGLQYAPTKVHIRELVMTPPPFQHAHHALPELLIAQAHPFFKAPIGCHEVRRSESALRVRLTHCTPLCGDVRVDVYKHKMKLKEKLFHFCFNTFFLAAGVGAVTHPPLPDSPNLETFKLTLNKWQLDGAHKDKQHKNYSQDFKVELIVQKLPDSSTFSGVGGSRAPSPPSSSASSCSEPDAEPDAWDSGERFPYSRLDYSSRDKLPLYCDTPPTYTGNYDTSGLGDERNYDDTSGLRDESSYPDKLPDYSDTNTPAFRPEKNFSADKSDKNTRKITDSTADNTSGINCCAKSDKKTASHNTWRITTPGFYPEKHCCANKSDKTTACHSARNISDYSADAATSERNSKDSSELYQDKLKYCADAKNCDDTVFASRKARDYDTPTVNPLYCSKADAMKLYSKDTVITGDIAVCDRSPDYNARSLDFETEPMEYANDVFSSAPTSARESPVDSLSVECKKRPDDKAKPRLSLGDMRASWREFSGKFAADSRRRKDES